MQSGWNVHQLNVNKCLVIWTTGIDIINSFVRILVWLGEWEAM